MQESSRQAPLLHGSGFDKPNAKSIRQARNARGPKLFTPEQIHALLKAATPNMAAMILLGLNAALGNSDLAALPIGALDLQAGWLTYPRPKTAIPRRIPLWPETVAAIRKLVEGRTEGLVFVGRRGKDYIGGNKGWRVHGEFVRVATKAGVEARRFYDLRRTFQTVADGAHDAAAASAVMGHAPASGDMAAIYRQGVSDDKLRAVVEHVRRWWGPPKPARKSKPKARTVAKRKPR